MIMESTRKMTQKEQTAYDLGFLDGKADAQKWISVKDRLPKYRTDRRLSTILRERRKQYFPSERCSNHILADYENGGCTMNKTEKTNGDFIRGMTDHELSVWLANTFAYGYGQADVGCRTERKIA